MSLLLKNRGYDQVMAFLPGWAMSYEIFSDLDLPYNYLFIEHWDPETAGIELKQYAEENSFSFIDLFGFSMGGFCAFEIIKSELFPVRKVFFAGIRNCYPHSIIEEVKRHILHNKQAYLSRFYSQCFFQRRHFIRHKELFKTLVENFSENDLLHGLDYLASHSIDFSNISRRYDIFLYHGAQDLIAPPGEIPSFDPEKITFIQNAGHLFWLEVSQQEWWKR